MRAIRFSRRSLLRGLGAGTVLLSGISRSLYAQTRTPRAVFLFYANGSHPQWTPAGSGTGFVLSRPLAPLEAIRNDIVICKNMTLKADTLKCMHYTAALSALGAGAPTSFDQVLAQQVRSTTPLASLEISIGTTAGMGPVLPGLSQVNGNFLPGVRSPVAAYQRIAERVTGGAAPPPGMPTMSTPGGAEQALLVRRSVLDFLKDDVAVYKTRLGAAEKPKLDFYLESLRTLERDIGGSMTTTAPIKPSATCSKIAAPDATLTKDAHVIDMPVVNHLFLDTVAMGLACGVTRIASAMWGGGQSDEQVVVPSLGIKSGNWHDDGHGDLSAGATQGENVIKVSAYMAQELVYFVQKLRSYADGAVSLLDNTVVVFGTQNGNVGTHSMQNTPMVLAGSCGGAWKSGQMIDCGGRNHNDVYIRIAQAFGLPMTTVGDPSWCKGPMPGLS
jgi:hypothetical protein